MLVLLKHRQLFSRRQSEQFDVFNSSLLAVILGIHVSNVLGAQNQIPACADTACLASSGEEKIPRRLSLTFSNVFYLVRPFWISELRGNVFKKARFCSAGASPQVGIR